MTCSTNFLCLFFIYSQQSYHLLLLYHVDAQGVPGSPNIVEITSQPEGYVTFIWKDAQVVSWPPITGYECVLADEHEENDEYHADAAALPANQKEYTIGITDKHFIFKVAAQNIKGRSAYAKCKCQYGVSYTFVLLLQSQKRRR